MTLDRTIAPPIKDAVDFSLKLKDVDSFRLSNGIPVYTIHAGAQDVVQVEWVYFAGNAVEVHRGVAAATNFLLKNGTRSKTAFQLNEHFEYYGAYCNRNCYNETATVTLHTLTRHLPQLLPVVREMLTEAVFPEEELRIYQQNSKQKLAVNLKKCDFVANRLIDARVYGEQHPYGRYNEAGDYDALTTDQLKTHYQAHYLRGTCVLFVSGKLPPDIHSLLEHSFGDLPLSPFVPRTGMPVSSDPIRVSGREILINDRAGVQSAIRLSRVFPNRHHPDYIPVMVLNTLFGGFFGSRLMANVREEKGYTYGIHSYIQNHIGQTAWMISTEAGRDVTRPAVVEIYKEMLHLREFLVDEEELQLVRNYMIGTILGDLDGPFQIIGRWKNIILNELTADYFYQSIECIKTITPEQLRELSRKYLRDDDFYELVVI